MTMNHFWTFLATSVLVLAAAMVAFHHDSPSAGTQAADTSRYPGTRPERTTGSAATDGPEVISTSAAPRSKDVEQVSDAAQSHFLRRQAAEAAVPHSSLTRAELERRAQLVEQDANHELDRLIPLLGLAPEQQARVFIALARSSSSYVPGMQFNGAPVQSSTGSGSTAPPATIPSATASGTTTAASAVGSQQPLLAVLSDAQAAAYVQDGSDRSAWWAEYIGNAAALLASGTPAVSGNQPAAVPASETVAPVDTAPATKAARAISADE